MLTSRVAVMLATAGLLAMPSMAVAAPNSVTAGSGEPDCIVSTLTGQCELSVTDEKQWPGPKKGGTKAKTVVKSSCRYKGQAIPCSTPEGFWDASSGCYLTAQAKPRTLGDAKSIPPGSRFYRCWYVFDVINGKPVGEETFESIVRRGGPPQTMDPREAARLAVEQMDFLAPQLGLSPYLQSATHEAIVNVPIWMWVTDPGRTTTGPQTKSALIGGVGIEATGTVDRIEWSMGGGEVVTCEGAGTPFDRAAVSGKSLKQVPDSPTCGYKYRKTSRCEKGGTFQVTATAYRNVHWTGGGTQGDIPLDFSRALPLRVVDLRPVLVASDGTGTTPQSTAPERPCP
jgi:hypothetical protein